MMFGAFAISAIRFVDDLPWTADVMLNLPHVVVSTLMLAAMYRTKPRATERVGAPAIA